jgi:hypothetical protein
MRKFIAVLLAIAVMTGSVACLSLSRSDEEMLRELKSYGIRSNEVKRKSAPLAACLNILPGIGDFYLAAGTDNGDMWLYGFLNLLTWPISILWAIPEGAIDAGTINKQETAYYYKFDKTGMKELNELKAREATPTPTAK